MRSKEITSMQKISLAISAVFATQLALAQTTVDELRAHPEFTASNYLVYQEPAKSAKYTKAPAGYKPFYISHYGRHGSRFHHSADEYKYLYETLSRADSANKLTEQGRNMLAYAKVLAEKAAPRAGDLTQTGVKQHEGIARRMSKNYAEVFKERSSGSKKITPHVKAYASTSGRCIVSMSAFLAEFRVQNPKIFPEMISGKSYMNFISSFDWNKLDYSKEKSYTNESDKLWQCVNPQPFLSKLFSDSAYVANNIDGNNFYNKFYEITTSLAGTDKEILSEIENESKTSIKDIEGLFTIEERIVRWKAQNAWWYSLLGTSPLIAKPDGLNFAKPTLQNILDEADKAIAADAEHPVAATLRFGHDTGLLPLSALMQLNFASAKVADLSTLHEQWNDFRVIPMAANLQIVFFKKDGKKANEVLVKFLYNEQEVTAPIPCGAADQNVTDATEKNTKKDSKKCPDAPYYRWGDVRGFYQKVIQE